MKEELVKTASCRQHPNYIRGQRSKTYSDELATALRDAKEWIFPAVKLQPIPADHADQKDGGAYWILDGTHRIDAAITEKISSIPAIVVSGLSPEDAIAYQIKENNAHGLRLSISAQTIAIKKLKELKVPQKTIAEKTGLSPTAISRILSGQQRGPENPEGTRGGSTTQRKKATRFETDSFFKGLSRILKIWEKHGTKIRKAGIPDVCGKALDTLAGKLLYGDDADKGGKE
jgi:hypothetical protein